MPRAGGMGVTANGGIGMQSGDKIVLKLLHNLKWLHNCEYTTNYRIYTLNGELYGNYFQ